MRRFTLAFMGDPYITARNGLDAGGACGLVELDEAEGIGEIRDGQRGHLVARSGVHRSIDAQRAVDDRILAVQTQMDVGWSSHGGALSEC